jgi:hypothetical protein
MKKTIALMTLAAAVSCNDDGGPIPVTLDKHDTAMCVALGIDYKNNVGVMSVVGLPSRTVVQNVVPGAVGGDAVLRANAGKLYVVNRYTNNITEVTPTGTDGQTWVVNKQFSTGAMSNPQDIAFLDNFGYVVTYGDPKIQVWDLSDPAPTAPVKTIDLSSATLDSDGNPEAQSIVVKGDRAYVTLDLLDDSFFPRGNGKILVIDLNSDTIVSSFELKYANPYNFIQPFGDGMVVVSDGDFSGTTGCIERFSTGATPASETCLLENSALSATIGPMTVTPDEVYFVSSTYDADFHPTSELHRVSSAGVLAPGTLTPHSETPADVAYVAATNQIVYGDTKAGGLRVFDIAAQGEVEGAVMDLGLVPGAVNDIVCMARN